MLQNGLPTPRAGLNRLRERMRVARWQLDHLRFALRLVRSSKDPSQGYNQLGDDLVAYQKHDFKDLKKPMWLNLGYWKDAKTYPEACRDMAKRLGELAELSPDDQVLDVGFGFAEQDFVWVEEFNVRKIIGLNVTPLHVKVGKARVAARKLKDRIDLRLGSATEMEGIPDNSVDKVMALECAFHFQSREKFFRQAMRVLRPGGRLTTADMLPPVGKRTNFIKRHIARLGRQSMAIPEENVYDRLEYARRLEQVGFTRVTVDSTPYVFPGMKKYLQMRLRQDLPMDQVVVELNKSEIASGEAAELWNWTELSDYVFFTADKPASKAARD